MAATRNITNTIRRRKRGWGWHIRRFFTWMTTLVLVFLLGSLIVLGGIFVKVHKDLPAPEDLVNYNPGGVTEIFANRQKNGKYLRLAQVSIENREAISITDIPQRLQDATVAIEDERFFNHPGVDLKGIARALYLNVRGGKLLEGQGGSTLTQQLARNVYLTHKKDVARKAQEIMLAVQIERNYSKQEILEMYLNEVYYGSSAYGVQAASKTYFGKKVQKVTLAEAALLAGLPQRPNDISPHKNLKAAVARRNLVLTKMQQLGYITPKEAQAAMKEKVRLVPYVQPGKQVFKAPYFVNYVLQQLVDRYGSDVVYRGGLKVYTTLNWTMQQEAEKALINGVKWSRGMGVTEGALVSVEPRKGFIRAMVGGVDYKKNQFNNAVQGKRQPGSAFKVFVYTAAIDSRPDRYGSYAMVDNSRIRYGHGRRAYRPGGGGPHGPVSIRTALTYSYNNAAVNTASAIGVQRVIKYARKMGIESEMRPTLALALGAYGVSPLEMASAYAVYANNGDRAAPMAIIRVLDHSGAVMENNTKPPVERAVIGATAVSQMSSMLQSVVVEGTASKAYGIHEVSNAHGKTGTTNDNKDAWFVGYTPELSTAVWLCGVRRVQKGDRIRVWYPPMSNVTGGKVCAPIWARFMKTAVPIQRQSGEVITPSPEKLLPPSDMTQAPRRRRERRRREADAYPSRRIVNVTPAERPAPVVAVAAGTDSNLPGPAINPVSTPAAAPSPPSSPLPTPVSVRPARPTGEREQQQQRQRRRLPARRVTFAAAPLPPREIVTPEPRPAPPPPLPPREITVTVCSDSGRRATRWCPETIGRTMVAARAPRGRCRIHRPRPGDG